MKTEQWRQKLGDLVRGLFLSAAAQLLAAGRGELPGARSEAEKDEHSAVGHVDLVVRQAREA